MWKKLFGGKNIGGGIKLNHKDGLRVSEESCEKNGLDLCHSIEICESNV